MPTKISWTDETWNFLGGCDPISPGCANCAAARSAEECTKHWGNKKYEGLTKNGKWTGDIRFFPDELEKPLHWKKPRMIFPAFMSDLFHPDVPFEFIAKVFFIMGLCYWHKFQILTKRADRMLEFFEIWHKEHNKGYFFNPDFGPLVEAWAGHEDKCLTESMLKRLIAMQYHYMPDWKGETAKNLGEAGYFLPWPLPNIYIGVSVENENYLRRIEELLQIPAAKRFISFEPLLENLKFDISNLKSLNQIIIGCESGPKRRQCKLEWVRSLVDQAKSAGVKVFVKQLDINGKVSHDMNEWPKDLQLQENI